MNEKQKDPWFAAPVRVKTYGAVSIEWHPFDRLPNWSTPN
jgi:hypothetical protein